LKRSFILGCIAEKSSHIPKSHAMLPMETGKSAAQGLRNRAVGVPAKLLICAGFCGIAIAVWLR
jgi:hypothetical protein